MIRLNIHEAKTHLSKYLAKLEKGETIVLCRRNQPIAEIRSISPKRKKTAADWTAWRQVQTRAKNFSNPCQTNSSPTSMARS